MIKYNPQINNYYNPSSERINNLFVLYNSTRFKEAINENNRPLFPFLSAIELTNYCDLKCLFCARQAMTRPKGYMDIKLFHKLLDQYREQNTLIKISGFGENLLHPHLDYFITEIKKYNSLHFTSNCQKLKIKTMHTMIENALDVLQVSFQGTNKHDYEEQRKGASYDLLIKNIIELVKRRDTKRYPFIHMSTTILDENDDQVENFINMCFDIGIDSVGIGRTEYDRFPDSVIKDKVIKKKIKEYRVRQTLIKIPDHSYLFRYMDVCWDGIVVSCLFDSNQSIPIGNANKDLLFNIWNYSKVMQALRILEENKLLNNMKYFDSFHFAFRGGSAAYNLRPENNKKK